MNDIYLKSYAKINLSLDVLKKRKDGYHNIDTIFQRIDLFDELDIKLADKEDCIILSEKPLSVEKSENLIYKAWQALKGYRKEKTSGVIVKLTKNIPLSAGLAGGSSNAAQMLLGLKKLWNLNITDKELKDIATGIGSDVPYFLLNEPTVRGTGTGNVFDTLSPFTDRNLLLVNTGKKVSSAYVYGKVAISDKSGIDTVIEILKKSYDKNNLLLLRNKVYNVMEDVTFKIYPEIFEIKKELLNLGASFSLMSGSGPSVFGFFDLKDDEDEEKYEKAYRYYKSIYENVFKCKTF